ncbi:MAG: phosphoglycerate dehydrogenase [Gemmatimonadetes bacterium]|nr:phosphoglycerate dehydrogenase [Gemmatimonadota bacterium]
MAKVLIADKLSAAAVRVFEERGVEAEVRTGLTEDQLVEIIGGFDGIAVRSATKVTKRVLEVGDRLRVVGRAGVGVDNVDVPAATARGVVVMNTPYGNSVTTAEHAIALMLASARQIAAADRSTRGGKWEKSRFMGMEVAGKTLGLIGCGNIGSIVASRAQGLGMRLITFDPFLSPERAKDLGVERVELDDLLRRADVISLHTPLNDSTRNILSAEALKKTRPGVRIVNCARGGLVDEEALAEAIRSGHVASAALDVFAKEPPGSSPLFELEDVIVTPHLGASTDEAQEKVAVQVAQQMAEYLITGAVTNAVNTPSISAEEAPFLKPYIELARVLGSLAGQITESGLKGVTLTYSGHASTLNNKPLTASALEGLLSPLLESVNAVNAPVVARERNIAVTTIERERAEGYETLIRLTVTTERGERTVAGTLFGGSPRLVEIHGIPLEAQIAPRMLYTRNADKPGFIGALGTTLGDDGVNVARFHLGRNATGDAVALIEVDQEISKALMDRIRSLPHVIQAKPLNF